MKFTPASSDTLMAFGSVVAVVIALVLYAFWYASRKLLDNPNKMTAKLFGTLVIWLGCVAITISSGVLEKHTMPLLPLYQLAVFSSVFWFAMSSWGARLALTIPVSFLVAFHIFRIPLEFTLYTWAEQGTVPRSITWAGQNYDLLTGLFALVIAPIAGRIRWMAWAFNIGGLLQLANIMRVILMSAPLPFSWHVEPPWQLAFHLPYGFIVPVCFGGAFAGHLILTRALLYH